MELVFATHNLNKLYEVKKLLPAHITLLSLNDIGCLEEIPETGATLEENAKIKADHVTKEYRLPCFSDDSGLIVKSLNGDPGVFSARYAGEPKNDQANMDKLLEQLNGASDRSAMFKTVIALNMGSSTLFFEGVVKGTISKEKRGDSGFGYDPIFRPDNFERTFAELPLHIKNEISHRGKAIQKLVHFLTEIP